MGAFRPPDDLLLYPAGFAAGRLFQAGNRTVTSEIAQDGAGTVIYAMDANTCVHPAGNLVISMEGDLYGVTGENDAAPESGTVFEVTVLGVGSIVHAFSGKAGFAPNGDSAAVSS